jgi:hypothetical protein
MRLSKRNGGAWHQYATRHSGKRSSARPPGQSALCSQRMSWSTRCSDFSAGGDRVIAQSKAVVTIEKIDVQGLLVSYRTQDGLRAARGVTDKRLLEGLLASAKM